jgi:hypothetical protein
MKALLEIVMTAKCCALFCGRFSKLELPFWSLSGASNCLRGDRRLKFDTLDFAL